jgi:hypothetical protein
MGRRILNPQLIFIGKMLFKMYGNKTGRKPGYNRVAMQEYWAKNL